MAFSFGNRTVTDGLVFYVDAANRSSYPGSGDTWYDLSGNNYNLTISGSVTVENNYIQFNSASEDYAYLNNTALQSYTNITAIIWKYSMTHTVTYEQYFAYNSDGALGDKGWSIRNTTTLGANQTYQAFGGNGTTSGNDIKFYKNRIIY